MWSGSHGSNRPARISINPPELYSARYSSRKLPPRCYQRSRDSKTKWEETTLRNTTVVDRWLQQAVSQQLMTRFELGFSDYSYGFRPKKNMQQALTQSLAYINQEYSDIVDIDLSKFFDEVAHYKILQLIYEKLSARPHCG